MKPKQEKTENKILKYVEKRGEVTAADLARHIGVSRQAIHRQVNKLQKNERLYKIGLPPTVFYLLGEGRIKHGNNSVDDVTKRIIDKHFINITPTGQRQEGFEGFVNWCYKRKDPLEKTAKEYIATLKKYEKYKKNGLIDGMYKMKKTFAKVFIGALFYLDFYSIERFGKTRLGQLLLYAKQSQNRFLIKELIEHIHPQVDELIKRHKIDAVGFIPPTVRREVQLMKELEKQLHLSSHRIALVKVKTQIAIPQKTLSKLEDRIENAAKTIMVQETKKFKNVLLIDDALGSGATLNEVARKLKGQKLAEKVIGLAIAGSFSGFEVISEV